MTLNLGYANPEDNIEIINVRITGFGRRRIPGAARMTRQSAGAPSPITSRRAFFEVDEPIETPVYRRNHLAPGHNLCGPAIIDQLDSTTILGIGDTLSVDEQGNLIIKVATYAGGQSCRN